MPSEEQYLQNEVDALKTLVRAQHDEIETLKGIVQTQRQEIEALKLQIAQLKASCSAAAANESSGSYQRRSRHKHWHGCLQRLIRIRARSPAARLCPNICRARQ